jgi:branched-chain amino acid aminotransferase
MIAVSIIMFCTTATAFSFVLNSPVVSQRRQAIRTNVALQQDPSKTKLYLASTAQSQKKLPGTADLGGLEWKDLGFEFRPTNSHIKLIYTEQEDGTGSWGVPELVQEPYVNVHIGATALHYGQTCFEGLKAFMHADGSVHLFRPEENAARMQSSCRRTLMPELPTNLFIQAVEQVVVDNIEFVPPYGSGGALYIRPLLFGSGPRIWVTTLQ